MRGAIYYSCHSFSCDVSLLQATIKLSIFFLCRSPVKGTSSGKADFKYIYNLMFHCIVSVCVMLNKIVIVFVAPGFLWQSWMLWLLN